MAKIQFYEKTGCINNSKQKRILSLAGHEVEAIDLIEYAWTADELLSFFEGMEVKDWFNRNAPRVSSGELLPESFDAKTAIDAMLQDHLLIKRPLLVIGDAKLLGFDKEKIDALVGIKQTAVPEIQHLMKQNLDDCPQKQGFVCDD